MAEIIVSDLAKDVLKKVGSVVLSEIASTRGFKTDLKKLKDTMKTLEDVLLDAEERQADGHAVRGWLERLAAVLYAADDLFDEYATVAARKQLMDGNKVTKEVITFFSRSNQVALARKFSRKIKKIREDLDAIEKDGRRFEFVRSSTQTGSAMMSKTRVQTMSYVDESEVVGRDDDKKAILDMLLASSSSTGRQHGHEKEVPVISIVGMGGMGKTTLAQLIYNDPQIKESFDLRLWVCVSDVFNIEVIIQKLLKSATHKETPNLELDQLQGLLQEQVMGKTYLLVLDDVWNEERKQWLTLRDLLKFGRKGSKILVTTRSSEVAKIMGNPTPYVLQGLSEENSGKLFEKMAFGPEEAQTKPHLVKIGKEIVKNCRHVPLAIRTLGSLLYGQEERKWLYIKNMSPDNQSDIMNILRLSYHHLSSPLKNCFAYCALFPKDYEFRKEMLIDLWIAEGYIVPHSDVEQSLDEAADEYFHTLLQRGFFQNIQRNSLEVIKSCKMHDFMHDLAQEVAGVKCKVAKSDEERNFDEKSVHVSLAYQLTTPWEIPNSMLNMKLLRTFLLPEQLQNGSPLSKSFSQQSVLQFRSLRVLDLQMLGLESLPNSIGKLIHLRYLNLSNTLIKKLLDSVTDLWNLQTLKLDGCVKLRELPANMRKLSNLRSLSAKHCEGLSHMPSGLGILASLNELPLFIVHYNNRDAEKLRYKPTARLSDLKNLNNLRGNLKIHIRGDIENSMLEATEAHLKSKQGLTKLNIEFTDCKDDCEGVLEGLEPPSGIRKLQIQDYRGEKLPRWAKLDNLCTALPNLVDIELYRWYGCHELPAFSRLPCLRRLSLSTMDSVEYIESDVSCGVPSSTSSSKSAEIETRFFPSLEELHLHQMYKLKGWWKLKAEEGEASEGENDNPLENASSSSDGVAGERFMQFPKLSTLRINYCPNLGMLPLCPYVEDLAVVGTNESLTMLKMATNTSSSSGSSTLGGSGSGLKKLKTLAVDDTQDLMSLPHHCLHQLSFLAIRSNYKLEGTERLGEVLATLSPSLRDLTFQFCHKLRSIPKGLEHLTALENLELKFCKELDLRGDEEEGGMPWKALNTSLRSLALWHLQKLVGLPRGLQHLANLRSLHLFQNFELEELPEWIDRLSSLEKLQLWQCLQLRTLPEGFRNLTSLRHLSIMRCPRLTERCRRPNGIDWPKIQRIPFVTIRE